MPTKPSSDSSTPTKQTNGHALITGGGSGIGLACAQALLADGISVTVLGRNEDKLATAVSHLHAQAGASGAQIFSQACDVANEASVAASVKAANDQQPLTIAVANAGIGGLSQSLQTTSQEWQQVMQTNLDGTFFTFKQAGQAIRDNGGGAMCAISSIAGLRTHRFMSAYCVSKAGIDMLVRNLADELGSAGIRVNSVCPGLVDTDIAVGLFATEEVHQDYLDCMPLGRTGIVSDIAQAVRFLCGPQASWITGVNLPVDGGHHLRRGPNLDVFSRMLDGGSA
jgi:NAD(P)-dependent dehydrogenase (short-subunit alcohol dehydrogenase family)